MKPISKPTAILYIMLSVLALSYCIFNSITKSLDIKELLITGIISLILLYSGISFLFKQKTNTVD